MAVADSAGSPEEVEALRWVSAGMEWLAGALLERADGWTGWVDGVIPATDMIPEAIQIVPPLEISVRGYAIWAKAARGPCWIEPFFGSIRISETDQSLIGYELRLADAARGLGKVPHGTHVRYPHWFFPDTWLFTFSRTLPVQ